MKDVPYITVIVPVYNGGNLLHGCIQSLLDQDYPKNKYEIIIVDNNSKDNTAEIVKQYPVRYVLADKKQSSYAARNAGITMAQGDILAFTDADCQAHKDWLSKLIENWEEKHIGIGGEIVQPPSKTVLERYHLGHYHQEKNLLGYQQAFVITANVAYKKEAFEKIGLFNENLVSGGDADFSWRLTAVGEKIQYCQHAKVIHHHKTRLSSQFKQAKRVAFGMIVLSDIYPHLLNSREHITRKFIQKSFFWLAVIPYRVLTFLSHQDKAYYLAEPFIAIIERYAVFSGRRLGLQYLKNNKNIQCPFE